MQNMNMHGERLATVEAEVKAMREDITHIDKCIDSLKRTVWQATGAAVVLVWIFERLAR